MPGDVTAEWWLARQQRLEFERGIRDMLNEAWLTELDRRLDAEVAGFKPLGILAALGVAEPAQPGSIAAHIDQQAVREVERRRQAERNERAVAWWDRATGRTPCHALSPSAPSADVSGLGSAPYLVTLGRTTGVMSGVRVASSDLEVWKPSVTTVIQDEWAVRQLNEFRHRVRHG